MWRVGKLSSFTSALGYSGCLIRNSALGWSGCLTSQHLPRACPALPCAFLWCVARRSSCARPVHAASRTTARFPDPTARERDALSLAVSQLSGERVRPGFVKAAWYTGGSRLPPHRDQVQNLYSISLVLHASDAAALDAWPLRLLAAPTGDGAPNHEVNLSIPVGSVAGPAETRCPIRQPAMSPNGPNPLSDELR